MQEHAHILDVLAYLDTIFDREGMQEMRGQAWNDSDRMLLQHVIKVLNRQE
jgi:hypothetical protein